jgi:hypothetical protein
MRTTNDKVVNVASRSCGVEASGGCEDRASSVCSAGSKSMAETDCASCDSPLPPLLLLLLLLLSLLLLLLLVPLLSLMGGVDGAGINKTADMVVEMISMTFACEDSRISCV